MISDKTNAFNLVPAPAFAIMALLTQLHADSMPPMLCWAAQDRSPLDGMLPMYLLMAAFHSPPWLRVVHRWLKRLNLMSTARRAATARP